MYNWKYQEALLGSDLITFYYLSNPEAPNSLPEGISLRFFNNISLQLLF